MRFPFFRNRDSVKNGILISIRRTGDGFHPGLFSLAERFGIASQLGKYPNELSGGQRQRASAARAIVKNPSILFADEPTGALDSNSATELLHALSEANSELNTTILMVTHDPYAASFANRILIFKDGQIIQELKKNNEHRQIFYEQIVEEVSKLDTNR